MCTGECQRMFNGFKILIILLEICILSYYDSCCFWCFAVTEMKEVDEEPCVEKRIHYLEETEELPYNIYMDKAKKTPLKKTLSIKTEQETVFAEKFGSFFFQVAGKDERLNAFELRRVMVMIFRKDYPHAEDFSLEACRSLISSNDKNRDGVLTYDQFKKLWFIIMKWKRCFDECDLDKNRKINQEELSVALKRLGINLNENSIKLIIARYANKQNTLDLDSFIQICSKTASAKESFDKFSSKIMFDTYLLESLYSWGKNLSILYKTFLFEIIGLLQYYLFKWKLVAKTFLNFVSC